jgi:hypothetical protein
MLGIFTLNLAVGALEMVQPFAIQWATKALGVGKTFEMPYLDLLVAALLVPALKSTYPFKAVQWIRDLVMAFFRPKLIFHVDYANIEHDLKHREESIELEGTRAPTAQAGREAAAALIEVLLREPAMMMRAFYLLIIFGYGWSSPILMTLFLGGIIVELYITLRMDAMANPWFTRQREYELTVRGAQYPIFDERFMLSSSKKFRFLRKLLSALRKSRDNNISLAWRLLCYTIARDAVSLFVAGCCAALLIFWIHNDVFPIASFAAFLLLIDKTNGPIVSFCNIQREVMDKRDLIRRLGLLRGIDFGIVRPEFGTK